MRFPLTLYALEPTITTFDDAIDPKAVEAESMTVHPISGDFDFDARLYVLTVEPKLPSWAPLLGDGFPDYQPDPSAMPRVALILRVDLDDEHARFFAATFGSGRYLLRRNSYQPGYGLKVALNSIYEGDSREHPLPSERLRAIKSTTVAKNTIRRTHQANHDAAFQEFGVDLQRDQLGQVVGAPRSTDRWGSRITGSDSIRLQVVEHLGDLGQLCEDLIALHDEDDFEVRFSAIDDFRTVPDAEVPALEGRLLELLLDSPEQAAIAPADLLDWDEVAEFRLSISDERFEEVSLDDVLAAIDASDHDLTLDLLKKERIECLADDGKVLAQWSLFDSLDAELRDGDGTVLLIAGRFYSIDGRYLDDLHAYLDRIPKAALDLPASTSRFETRNGTRKKVEETEGDYNERAANETGFLLLDKKTVRLEHGGDPIEICDLFSPDRHLIHVKRKFGSSSLSHLFAQGSVSGDLLLTNDEFRDEVSKSLAESEAFRALAPAGLPKGSDYEVVYAIIGPWKGQSLAERLPFFSKINLRRHTQDLRARGFRVSYSPIDLLDPA